VVKNKVAAPFRTAEFDTIFGKGISRAGDLLDVATGKGIIARAGTYYSFADTRLGQGRDNARQYLEDNPELLEEIDSMVRQAIRAERGEATPAASASDEA
jgi:recombination protein RecA